MHFPNESSEYRAARDALKQREIELRRLTESVAQQRRALPAGGAIPTDYVFEGMDPNAAPAKLTLSQLFEPDRDTLAIYSYMFGPERDRPCPMCTPLLDGLDAVEDHIRQRVSLAIVAESPIAKLAAFSKERGWRHLRLFSAAGNTYNRDYHGKSASGSDSTMLNVFQRDGATIRHFWGTELAYGPSDPGQDPRGLDPISPIFAMFDLTPQGRGDWYTKLSYP